MPEESYEFYDGYELESKSNVAKKSASSKPDSVPDATGAALEKPKTEAEPKSIYAKDSIAGVLKITIPTIESTSKSSNILAPSELYVPAVTETSVKSRHDFAVRRFFMPIVGEERSGKSSLGTSIALALSNAGEHVYRIQCENTCMFLSEYEALKPLNAHVVMSTQAKTSKPKIFVIPDIVTQLDVETIISAASAPSIFFIDGVSNIISPKESQTRAERGFDIFTYLLALQRFPFLTDCLVTATIPLDMMRRDLSGRGQGYVETVKPVGICNVMCPFDRTNIRMSVPWSRCWAEYIQLENNEKYLGVSSL